MRYALLLLPLAACDGILRQPFDTVSAGTFFWCGVGTDGQLACLADPDEALFPTRSIEAPPTGSFATVDVDFGVAVALRTDGRAVGWTSVAAWDVEVPDGTYLEVRVGEAGAVALTDDGRVEAWAYADGDRWERTAHEDGPPPGISFTQIDVGSMTCGVSTDHDLHCWGAWIEADELLPVPDAAQHDIEHVSVSSPGACALRLDGGVLCWGRGETLDVAPLGAYEQVAVADAAWWACGRLTSGRASRWGNTRVYDHETSPPDTPFTHIDTASSYGCGVRASDHLVQCWGDPGFAVR